MIKNIILKLTLFSLIAGTAFMPQPIHGMNWLTKKKEELNKQLLGAARSLLKMIFQSI